MKKLVLYLALAALCALSTPVMANVTYGFYNTFPNDDAVNGDIGEAQFSVTVSEVTVNGEVVPQVLFTFNNTGTELSTICDIYFDDGALLGIANLLDKDDDLGGIDGEVSGDDGVDFSPLASAPAFPTEPADSFIDPAFETTAGFALDSDPPNVHLWGIDPGESLGVLFDLKLTDDDVPRQMTYADVLIALGNPSDTINGLRIGIRAQGLFDIQPDNSEHYINNPVPIPAPGAIMLGGMGVVFVGWLRRRRTL